jgi:hypothetical protein
MPYIEVHAQGISGPVMVRWQDGVWTGSDLAMWEIARYEELGLADWGERPGFVSLTPTGPTIPIDSARGAAYLALNAFERVDGWETDIDLELPPLPPGAIP